MTMTVMQALIRLYSVYKLLWIQKAFQGLLNILKGIVLLDV